MVLNSELKWTKSHDRNDAARTQLHLYGRPLD